MKTRRSFLALGSVAMSGLLPIGVHAQTAGAHGSNLFVVGRDDPSFDELLRANFPDAMRSKFLRDHGRAVALLVNLSSVPLLAVTLKWTGYSKGVRQETYQFTKMRRPSRRLLPLSTTAAEPVIPANGIALVTPASFTTPNGYALRVVKNGGRKGIYGPARQQQLQQRRKRGFGFLVRAKDKYDHVEVEITAATTSKGALGPYSNKQLNFAIRNRRNAEHDEAVSLLRQINNGSAANLAGLQGAVSRSIWLSQQPGVRHPVYVKARASFAQRIVYLSNVKGMDHVRLVLSKVAGQAKAT